MKQAIVLCLAVVSAACMVGDEQFVPPDEEGIVTAPRHGAEQSVGDVAIEGLYSVAGASVVVER